MKEDQLLKKVNLSELMDVMMDLWTRGVDYVDISILPGEHKIALFFTEEYLSKEAKDMIEEEEDIPEYREVKGKLTDEDLNQLL